MTNKVSMFVAMVLGTVMAGQVLANSCGVQICAVGVESNSQGTLNNGGAIPASWNRADPAYATGLPDGTGSGTFYSLGYVGGSIVLDMGELVSGELTVYEATNYTSTGGDYPAEFARVYGSQNPNGPWTYIGAANNSSGKISNPIVNTNTTTLGLCGAFYRYVKLEDASNPVGFGNYKTLDGFDLDAVCVGSCPIH